MKKQSYVKPMVMQLHYSTDPGVTIAAGCKTVQATGPNADACQPTVSPGPCVAPES